MKIIALTTPTTTAAGLYKLIDFGGGRKLESLGGYIVDRPSPASEAFSWARPADWQLADARYDEATRQWHFRNPWPDSLCVRCESFVMPVRPTPFGHIGVFPEQASNWAWLASRPAMTDDAALNLFGYTGASTIALVSAGYQVAHVDAAKPNVNAARMNVEFNGHAEAKVRYLVDDAAKFSARERRRNRVYQTVTLDPPAYGHAPGGRAWRLQRDLWPMLDDLLAILDWRGWRLLVTGHSPEVDQNDVVRYLLEHARVVPERSRIRIDKGRSQLCDSANRPLDTGFYVRAEFYGSDLSSFTGSH